MARKSAVAAGYVALAPVLLWSVLALWFMRDWPGWLGALLALGWAAAAIWALVRLPLRWSALVLLSGAALVLPLFLSLRPSNERDWTPEQARTAYAIFEGDTVCVQNVRFMTCRTKSDCDVRWEKRCYDLREIRTVDFVVSAFSAWKAMAHTFLTFGFEDGQHVAVSVEVRKVKGQSFSALKGLFRQYEIIYVIGDERDVIGVRANVNREPVYLYPIRITPEHARGLFVSMLQRADALSQRPEFYNTLTNTCTTNIVRHIDELTGRSLGVHYQVTFPGYADDLAYKVGLIDTRDSLRATEERCLINSRSAFCADGIQWSRQIRGKK
jgi:hypothetical protein